MIQRIQSLYLSMLILLCLLLDKGSILIFSSGSGKILKFIFSGKIIDQAGQIFGQTDNIWLLYLITILLPLFALITILAYKNRRIQLFFALAVILFSAGQIIVISWYAYTIAIRYNIAISPWFKMAIPILDLFLSVLAYRGIKKDDRLVKSYDRLR
jgi:hypothetical protein